mmetsp:Transcript_8452/g.17593  ORF Transcript_8452/g.17593 Transcript_8452/m.17593 type:complete len:233 (-) Transcript_8452:154-852(-)
MNYGQRGRELLLDLKRSDWLPTYNEEGVRATLQEISLHTDELTDLVRAAQRIKNDAINEAGESTTTIQNNSKSNSTNIPMTNRPSLILHDASIRRNKRCLLAYHAYRMDKLRALRWETGGTLPEEMKRVLSEAEVDFFEEYDRLVSRFVGGALAGGSGSSGMGNLDWNADLVPPQENYIMVRVVQSGLGKIETELCGVVDLELGSTHYLPRGDVEGLVRQGALVQLTGEESV